MRKIVFAALCAFAAVAVSCKNDRESDVNPGDSDIDGLYINEVYSCNPDWVELYNAGNEELHIGGFILQDDKGAEEEYVIPEGTTIGAGEFLVLEEFSFGISSSKGDRVTLLDASRNVVDDVMLPVMEDGSSYGRRSDGGSEFAAFTAPTKGRSNTGGGDPLPEPEPSDAKVYINEVLSAPAGDDMDFIELYNGGEADNFRPGADDGHQFQTGHCYTSSKKVSGLSGSKHSLHHSSVTRFSVSLRFTILCVYPGIISTTVISSPLT